MNLKCNIWTSVRQQAGSPEKQVTTEDNGNIIMEANFIRQLSRHLTTTTYLSEPHKHVNICEEATFRMDITHAAAIKGTCIIHIAKQLSEKHGRIHRGYFVCMYITNIWTSMREYRATTHTLAKQASYISLYWLLDCITILYVHASTIVWSVVSNILI